MRGDVSVQLPQEVAHILALSCTFKGGVIGAVRGVFTYRVNDGGLHTYLRGFWNMDAIEFGNKGESN